MTDQSTTLEITNCSRCGGNGQYSYCPGYGTTCFKCRGKGTYLTKRGHAAALFLEALRSIPASEVKVGDLIRCDATDAYSTKSWFAPVVEVRVETETRSSSLRDGAWVENPPYTALVTEHPKHGRYTRLVFPDTKIRKGFSGTEKAEQLRLALAYQDTLTRLGTPRKVKAPA